jgi:hypothetical protein
MSALNVNMELTHIHTHIQTHTHVCSKGEHGTYMHAQIHTRKHAFIHTCMHE